MELNYHYAQLNADGYCFAVTTHGEPLLDSPALIRLDSYDESRLGKTYTNGEWSPA